MAKKVNTFEENMQRLEEIVRIMERGEVSLDESLKLFQEGTKLVSACGKLLDEAELRINKIVAGPDGAPVEEEFDEGSAI